MPIHRLAAVAVVLQAAFAQPAWGQAGDDPESHLAALGLTLPAPNAPVANYVSAVRTGNLVFLAGHIECGSPLRGKVGADVGVDSAYASARRVGLCLLASLKAEIGDLRRVARIVRVFGMVNATPDFTDQSRVVNGCSDLLVDVFGERGRHARAALGVASLPGGVAVEIEMVVEIRD